MQCATRLHPSSTNGKNGHDDGVCTATRGIITENYFFFPPINVKVKLFCHCAHRMQEFTVSVCVNLILLRGLFIDQSRRQVAVQCESCCTFTSNQTSVGQRDNGLQRQAGSPLSPPPPPSLSHGCYFAYLCGETLSSTLDRVMPAHVYIELDSVEKNTFMFLNCMLIFIWLQVDMALYC